MALPVLRSRVQHGEHSEMVRLAEGCSAEMGRAMRDIMRNSMQGCQQMVTAFMIMQEMAAAG